jgi:hypothetical protein
MQNPPAEEMTEMPDPTQTAPAERPQKEQTSDYYRTNNIPARFENPGKIYKISFLRSFQASNILMQVV